MRQRFVERVLGEILRYDGTATSATWLAVCGGQTERDSFLKIGLRDATISNFDARVSGSDVLPFTWSAQNALQLAFADRSFDYAFVSDGLHHCSSPHRALLEMYRVCRRAIIVIESRDSALMRLAEATGLTARYEIAAVIGNDFVFGGVDNTAVPNHVYRWTEREFEKTIQSFDPTSKHRFQYYYDLNLPKRTGSVGVFLRAVAPPLTLFTRVFPRQCNTFAMIAHRPRDPEDLWPWLRRDGEKIVFKREYVG